MKNRIPLWVIIALGISFLTLLFFRPSQMPPLFFDEGWTLSVARNWVETGQHARCLNNEAISATGMAWNFPVTGPISLCFRIFGIGIWQGRLPSMLFIIAAILFIYLLAKQMYNEKIAAVAMFILLIGSPFPLIYGRQAIGEPAMIFYLLAGFYLFGIVLINRSILSSGASILLWGAALTSKQQTLPFWLLSMLAILIVAGLRRDRFSFWMITGITLGTLIAWQGMLRIQAWLETGLPLYGAPMQGLLFVTGWIPVWQIRILAWIIIAKYILPLIPALGYALHKETLVLKKNANTEPIFYLRLSYWTLTTSWFLWFVTLAISWDRYLYPIAFTGSIFLAVFLDMLTGGFNFSQVVTCVSNMLRKFQFQPQELTATLSIVLLCYMGVVALRNLTFTVSNGDAEKVAEYLNSSTASTALLETYDSELLFLVQRPFHYPPDQVQVELNRRTFLNQNVEIHYDPLAADPDYIVIGPYSKMWKLYDCVQEQQHSWHLVYDLPTYRVYQHIR